MATITGTSGDDILVGGSENDTIFGAGGDDWLVGGDGNDTLNGGANGTWGDTADYANDPAGVYVDLVACLATDGYGDTDTVFVEHVQGSAFNDTLLGDGATNWLRPGPGNDSLNGAGGNDVVFYWTANGPVTVNLVTGTASGSNIGNDTLTSIESAQGSPYGDTIILGDQSAGVFAFGRAGADAITGGNGDNTLTGGSGGDTLAGGSGFDAADYSSDTFDNAPTGQGVNVNLAAGTAIDNWGDTDTLSGIEIVFGSPYGDTITGGNPANGSGATDGFENFQGNAGNDTIDGGAGFDRAQYTSSTAAVTVVLGGTGDGSAQDGLGGTDVLRSIEEVRGSPYNDTLTGSSSGVFESFEGRGGNDSINGGGGLDRINFQSSPAAVNVDMAGGTATDGWGGIDTFTNIDNVRGSDFNDTITGDANANDIEGRVGNDSIHGGAGNDTMRGSPGNDTIDGGSEFQPVNTANENSEYDAVLYTDATSAVTIALGADGTAGTATGGGVGTDVIRDIESVVGSNYGDVISGSNRANREIIRGGLGNDTMSGGDSSGSDPGFDQLNYTGAPGGVTVNLATGTASGAEGDDVFSGFEGILAGEYADFLVGSSENGYFEGRGGNDTIDGGAGNDRLSFSNAPGSVVVDMAAGTSSGAAGNDVFTNIEGLRGSEYADTLQGGSGNDDIQGRDGNDVITLGAGQDTGYGGYGDDTLDGGSNDPVLGNDWLVYNSAPNAVNVNMATGTAAGEGTDTFSNFEAVAGSDYADTLTGDALDNVLQGRGGNDTMDGGAGNDWVEYGGASGAVTVSLVTGTSSGADDTDTFTGIERIRGSAYDDSLTGDAADNVLRGNAGNDTLVGGQGNDTADYYLAAGSVTVNLAAGTSSGADGSDTFTSIENVWGPFNYADTITGTASANYLNGLGGADSIVGSDGNDTLVGGNGNDTLDGGNGTDTAQFSGPVASYTVTYDPLDDSVVVVEGPQGRDTLIDIEFLQFSDATFALAEQGTDEDDELEGGDEDEVINGRAGNDHVRGRAGNDALYGDEGDDDLQGDEGDDLLDGGTGSDTMAGGTGNDTYVVDSAADSVVEPDSLLASVPGSAAQVGVGNGIDRVIASINYTLGNAVENLTLAAGGGALQGMGNALGNSLGGNEANNALTGAGGNDSLDGGAGIDTAVYTGSREQYTVAIGGSVSVAANATTEGSDTLIAVERLQFADGRLAVDLDGHAGEVAKIIGILFGPGAVANEGLAALGLQFSDSGIGYEALMDLALDAVLGADATSGEVVTLLYTNLIGSPPDAATRDHFAAWIDEGLYTPAGLAVLAADLMGIPSAAQNGLAFT